MFSEGIAKTAQGTIIIFLFEPLSWFVPGFYPPDDLIERVPEAISFCCLFWIHSGNIMFKDS